MDANSTRLGVKGDRKTPLPTWVKPQLAALVKKAPDGPDWLHEIKLDGYRMHARLDAGRVKILTRRGNNWTDKYPSIAKALTALPANTAYLDGELCGVLPDGRTAFNLMQNAMEHGDGSLIFFAFDLLHLDGESLMALPLVDRKKRLETLLAGVRSWSTHPARPSGPLRGDRPAFGDLRDPQDPRSSRSGAPVSPSWCRD
jgi:ATP-dependent DNA ligase